MSITIDEAIKAINEAHEHGYEVFLYCNGEYLEIKENKNEDNK